jgi:hypothetical protein
MTCWDARNNTFYAAAEVFDDIYNPSPSVGLIDTYLYDDMNIVTDADHSGGTYQYGTLPKEQWGQTGQQWMFMASPGPYHMVLRISGATWMNGPPYSDYFAIVKKEATGTRIFHEVSMVLWDFLSPDGPEKSTPHILKKDGIVGLGFIWDDYDEDPKTMVGFWKTSQVSGMDELAQNLSDWQMLGPESWDVSKLPTAVSLTSWGAVKATFTR